MGEKWINEITDQWIIARFASHPLTCHWCVRKDWGWFNTNMSPHQYRNSHCWVKTILRSSYLNLQNGISYKTSLFCSRALPSFQHQSCYWLRKHIICGHIIARPCEASHDAAAHFPLPAALQHVIAARQGSRKDHGPNMQVRWQEIHTDHTWIFIIRKRILDRVHWKLISSYNSDISGSKSYTNLFCFMLWDHMLLHQGLHNIGMQNI